MLIFPFAAVQVSTDWVGLIDEWSFRFFNEMDYELEAANCELFRRQMAGLDGIYVPEVYRGLSSSDVLTTSWVNGEPGTSFESIPMFPDVCWWNGKVALPRIHANHATRGPLMLIWLYLNERLTLHVF
jgi:ABC1 atypical kinase-like domain